MARGRAGRAMSAARLGGAAALFGLARYVKARRDIPPDPILTPHPLRRHTDSAEVARRADLGQPRGRDAASPGAIPWRGWKDILWRAWRETGEDHLGLIAAGVAFYGLLAVFPAIAVGVALAGLVTHPADFVDLLNDLSRFLPHEAARILVGQAREVAGARNGGLGLAALFGLGFAFWSASRGMASLIEGLNVTYDEVEKRGFVRRALTALALTLVLIAGTIVGLAATVIVPAGIRILGAGADPGWLPALRWPILAFGTFLGLAILYRYGPSREQARWAWISPGAIVACGLWLGGTAGFAYYAGNFARYNQTFGTLGGAIVLLMWFWLSAYVVLLGAELNAEIEAQTGRDFDHRAGIADGIARRGEGRYSGAGHGLRLDAAHGSRMVGG